MTKRKFIDTAFTGLEAAIVLVAFVVVAAVFAYVILGSGFMTTQKSQEVVHSSIAGVSSTLQLTGEVYGISTGGTTIDMVNFSVSLAPGGTPIDFSKVAITYSDESHIENPTPVAGLSSLSTTPGTWAVISANGQTGSFSSVLEKGQQFEISVHPSTGTSAYGNMNVEVKYGGGAAISIKRTVPAAVNTVNILY